MKKILLLAALAICTIQNIQAQVIEDFETWSPYSIGIIGAVQMNEPVGWSCTDSFIVGIGKLIPSFNVYQSQLIKESPGHAGNGAMKLATKLQGALSIPTIFSLPSKVYPAIASNATFSLDIANFSFGQSGGTAISFAPSQTTMYVKNNVVSGDSTFITATLLIPGTTFDTIIATADTILSTNVSSYTQLTLPFNYIINNQTPTIVRYTISSGNPLALLDTTGTFAVHAGTEIVVDDIEISGSNGIRQLINSNPIARVYPTAGGDVLYVDLLKQMKDVTFQIYSLNGQLVQNNVILKSNYQIDLSNLSGGTYIFSLKADDVIYQTGKFVH